MKFGKRLQSQIEETMPEWRDKFLSYKQLKKRLKVMSAPVCFTEAAFEAPASPPRGSVDQIPSSAVDAVDQELRRASEVGGPAAVQETIILCRSKVSKLARKKSGDGSSSSASVTEGGEQHISRATSGEISTSSSEQAALDVAVVKSARGTDEGAKAGAESRKLFSSELDFVQLLNKELNKLNFFFLEKEEEYVIRLQELKDRIESIKIHRAVNDGRSSENSGSDEVLRILRDIVTFHGEMVLLENYSSLNYTGLVKILKKFDKLKGTVLRLPYIQSVLLQPFFTTELLSKLVRDCESNLHSLFLVSPVESVCTLADDETSRSSSSQDNNDPPFSPGEAVETIYRSTVAALRTMQVIREESSTRSIFSLPPVNRLDSREKHGAVIDERPFSPVAVSL